MKNEKNTDELKGVKSAAGTVAVSFILYCIFEIICDEIKAWCSKKQIDKPITSKRLVKSNKSLKDFLIYLVIGFLSFLWLIGLSQLAETHFVK